MQTSPNNSFEKYIHDIISSEAFCSMQEFKHHLQSTTYEHSVEVAYMCFQHYQKYKSQINLNELIRGALLHDYFLYDRHARNNRVNGLLHGFTHPKRALENAMRDYPDLTETEKDVIKHHMFPLTPIPPKTKCGWLVCYYDKLAAIRDYCCKSSWRKEPVLCYTVQVSTNKCGKPL